MMESDYTNQEGRRMEKYIDELETKLAAANAQIKQMRNCQNCKHKKPRKCGWNCADCDKGCPCSSCYENKQNWEWKGEVG